MPSLAGPVEPGRLVLVAAVAQRPGLPLVGIAHAVALVRAVAVAVGAHAQGVLRGYAAEPEEMKESGTTTRARSRNAKAGQM